MAQRELVDRPKIGDRGRGVRARRCREFNRHGPTVHAVLGASQSVACFEARPVLLVVQVSQEVALCVLGPFCALCTAATVVMEPGRLEQCGRKDAPFCSKPMLPEAARVDEVLVGAAA